MTSKNSFYSKYSELIKSTATLSIVALCASIILALTYSFTSPKISALEEEEKSKKIQVVLPEYTVSKAKTGKNNDGQSFNYWIGEKKNSDKKNIAYAIQSENNGYSGKVKILLGVDSNFKIIGLSILKQSETPGLGARCEEVEKPSIIQKIKDIMNDYERISKPWFTSQYIGLDTKSEIKVIKGKSAKEKNEISAITGATITTVAITGAVKKAISNLQSVLKQEQ